MKNRSTFFYLVTLIGTAALVLAGCSPAAAVSAKSTSIPPTSSAPVTITFWDTYNAQAEVPYVNKTIIPAFEAQHPNIKVQEVNVPYGQFTQKLVTALAGGSAPDVASIDIIWTPQFASMGVLVPLDQSLSDFSTFKAAVFPGPLSTNFWQGHNYGLPLDTNTRVLIYNKDIFQQAGIANPPLTMDEFLADCAKIKALGPNHYCFADDGIYYGWAVGPWVWSFGGSLTDTTLTRATGYLNGSQTVAAYTFLKNAIDKGYIEPSGFTGGGVDQRGGLAKGEIAMILDGPWFPSIFDKQFPNVKYGMAPFPSGSGGSISVVGGEDIAEFQQSKNKEAATEFLRFMLSVDTQIKMAAVGDMPVLTAADQADNLSKMPGYFNVFFEALKTAQARTPTPVYNQMESIFSDDGAAILSGKVTVHLGLDDAATRIDKLLAAVPTYP